MNKINLPWQEANESLQFPDFVHITSFGPFRRYPSLHCVETFAGYLVETTGLIPFDNAGGAGHLTPKLQI